MPSYNCWTKHGERGVIMEEDEEGDDIIDDNYLDHFGDTFMEDGEGGEGDQEEARDEPADDLGRTIADARRRCETEKERENLDRITYEAKKVVFPLGLEVLKIHACINDCILYRGEYENLNECPVCTALRYKIRGDDPGDDVEGEKPRKKVPAKVMWPEGSIAKGYGNEEVIEFCVDFVPNLKPIGLPRSWHEGRLSGKGTIGRKSTICMDGHSLTEAHHTVLTNSSLVAPYFEKHKNILRSDNPGKPESWIRKAHMETFGSWLRKHLMHDNKVVDQLYMLAKTPSSTITTFQGYEINGNTFYTIAQDKKSTNQNSGVRFDAATENGQKVTYYGYIEEIWELDYGPSFKVPLFRCKWFKLTGGGVKVDQQYGMTMVDFNNLGYLEEPFVLAKDVAQVFYVKDMSSKPRKRKDKKMISTSCDDPKRHIVLSGKGNIVGVEDKTDMSEDYNMFGEIPPFKVNTDPSIKLNDEDAPWIRPNRKQAGTQGKK
ncbi:hypothetical protein QYE76_006155 [Lolium multiflorum]|uniref:DUF4216 domain-containing protein n=1 Tax=Lolium multiflorum TaxID=4521 RepID=A0AAD8RV35_LOLMU|nr:hypothetical protein QYE76_006155 [Lolium multiflorum]